MLAAPHSVRLAFTVALSVARFLTAAPADPSDGPVAPPADSPAPTPAGLPRLIRPGVYAIGQVTLDQTRRTVSFPAAVNQRAGLIEYLVVTTGGKIHESVFRTEAEPQHIHVALLLLGVTPANTNAFADDPLVPLPGERVTLEAVWKQGRREVRQPLEAFVKLPKSKPAFHPGSWVYNGSFVVDGRFLAQLGGSIVSLQTDPTALINNPARDRDDDEIHFVNPKPLPRAGTLVAIVIHVPAAPSPAPRADTRPAPAAPRNDRATPSARATH